MKKLICLLALSATMTGCGVNAANNQVLPATVTSVSTPAAAPAKGVAPLTAAPTDADAAKTQVPMAAADPMADALSTAKKIAGFGTLVTDLNTLTAPSDTETAGYGVQSTPRNTQMAADTAAHAWSPDATQLWLGWGFKTISWFGHSRHVYFSASKKRLLTIDYGFFGNKIDQYETTGLVVEYAGKLIATLLQEPHDIYPVRGRDAYNLAKNEGYVPTHGEAKVLMINPLVVGPKWLFLNADNKPQVIVDANTGEVSNGGVLLTLLGYLF